LIEGGRHHQPRQDRRGRKQQIDFSHVFPLSNERRARRPLTRMS
jgi:hypothetical protein